MRLRSAGTRTMLVVIAVIALGASQALAQTTTTYRDEFTSTGYGGNNGSASFSGSWRERGESDGPSAGIVRVVTEDRCSGGAGNCLRIGSDGGDIGGIAIDRSADLASADTATLDFVWRRRSQGKPAGSVRVRVAPGTGGPWTTLATIDMSGANGPQSSSFDISAHTSGTTTIRFEGVGTGVNAYLYFDDITITASGSTTTTTAPTTTTTAPTTTTTAPTTTTTAPTTTTVPGSSTTTSTTAPGSTSPTTTPDTTSTTAPGSTSPTTTLDTTSTTAPGATVGGSDGDTGDVSPGESDAGGSSGQTSSGDDPDAVAAAKAGDSASGVPGPSVAVLIASQVLVLGGLTAATTRAGVLGTAKRDSDDDT